MAKVIDLRPQNLDLKMYSGDGVLITLEIVDIHDAPVVLTGSVRAHIRARVTDASPLETFNVDLTNKDTGVAVLSLTGSQTTALTQDKRKFIGVWDVEWHPTGSEPRTLCAGKAECEIDATR